MEVQLNGGSISDKVDFAREHFEKEIPVNSVFALDECIVVIGVNQGHGFKGKLVSQQFDLGALSLYVFFTASLFIDWKPELRICFILIWIRILGS